MRILVVEDDTMIGEAVAETLKEASCAVDWVLDGRHAINAVTTDHYDMVLLDLGLPGRDGIEVLRAIRAARLTVPVMIITARDRLEDRVTGLDEGADDYVLKPFELAELMARMRALFRRSNGQAEPVLSNGHVSLDPATREAQVPGIEPVRLSNREFSLVQALLLRPGAILSRTALEDRLYGWGEEVESNAVEFLIHSVRKKLGADTIKNIRGAGWMIPKKP